MAFMHPVKRVFDRLLNAPGQTLFLGFALGAFGKQLGFKASFTASPLEVQAISDRKDTRAPVAQEMLRLNGIQVIFTQPDARAAYLKAMLQRHLGKPLQIQVANQVAAKALEHLLVAAQTSAPAKADADLFSILQPVIEHALLEAYLGAPLTQAVKTRLSSIPAAPVGIEGVGRVFAFALVSRGTRLERWLSPAVFGRLLKFCLPKVAATRDHHRAFSAVIRGYIVSRTHLNPDSWLGDLLADFEDGRTSGDDLDGEIAGVYDMSYTLGIAAMWSVMCVANHPEHQLKLRAQSQQERDPAEAPPYNHARLCVLEAMRLYPPFYMLAYTDSQQQTKKDSQLRPVCPLQRIGLRSGPANTVVSVQGLHRNPTVWQDANRFWPERFQDVGSYEGKKITKGGFIPFGVGHRACPGRALSMAAIERLLLTLFGSESPVNMALLAGMPKPKRNALLMAQDPRVQVSLAPRRQS